LEKIKIFSGQSHQILVEKICQQIGVPLSPLKIEEYKNGCFEVILKDNVCDKVVFLVQTSLPDFCCLHASLWELFQMVNAALRSGAKEAIVVMPYISYARSDKIYIPGMTISGELLIRLLETAGMRRFIGVDVHSNEFEKFFSKTTKFHHLSAMPLIIKHLMKRNLGNAILLPADQGILGGASALSKKLNIPLGSVKKERINDSEVKIRKISGDFSGKDVIILDDEISVGTTVRTLGRKLEKAGNKSLRIAVTHGVFLRETVENLQKLETLKEVIVTDTVYIPKTIQLALPLKILSVAGLLAKMMRKIAKET